MRRPRRSPGGRRRRLVCKAADTLRRGRANERRGRRRRRPSTALNGLVLGHCWLTRLTRIRSSRPGRRGSRGSARRHGAGAAERGALGASGGRAHIAADKDGEVDDLAVVRVEVDEVRHRPRLSARSPATTRRASTSPGADRGQLRRGRRVQAGFTTTACRMSH